MPDFFDFGDVDFGALGQRGFDQARRHADAQRTGQQFDQRKPFGCGAGVEPGFEQFGRVGARRARQFVDDLGRRRRGQVDAVLLRPDQRHGFGEVADIFVAPTEQFGIDATEHQVAHRGRLQGRQVERRGDGRQRPAAVGIGLAIEIVDQQPDLAVARRREIQTFEEFGETPHQAASSAHGRMSAVGSDRAAIQRWPHSRIACSNGSRLRPWSVRSYSTLGGTSA